MKRSKIYMGFLAICVLLLSSCSKDETATGSDPSVQTVDLTFGAILNDLGNRTSESASLKNHFLQVPECSDSDPAYVVLEISYDGQAPETEGEITIDILSDGSAFFTAYSELLKIPVEDGEVVSVSLNSFRVYDSGDNLIWIAPIGEDEDFAGYLDEALPQEFQVRDGTKPYIDVEVLCYDDRMVNEYGYPFFDLVPGVLYPVCFFANYCPSPDGRHYVGNYEIDLYYDDGTTRVQLYDGVSLDDMDDADYGDYGNGNYYADPLCLVIPESPFDDPEEDYLFYVVTPLDWPGNYGDIDNTPLPEVGLSWSDIEEKLNDDGETVEYFHLFIGCEPPLQDCPLSPEVDPDGDCVPNFDDCVDDDCDNCPDKPNPNQEDGDHDGWGDVCDNCPDNPNDQTNSDDDTYGDACDKCPFDTNQDQADGDGDGEGDVCDECPNVRPEDDYDGDCKPNNDDPCPYDRDDNCPCPYEDDDDCEEPNEGQCGTAFMFSEDHRINQETNSNRWGWIEYYDEDTSITRKIYVGAGQNDLSKGTHIGEVTISRDGDNLDFDFDLLGDYKFSSLHIHVADDEDEAYRVAKSPGRYNQNGILNGLEDQSLDILGDLDDDFWVIVHGDACDHDHDNDD